MSTPRVFYIADKHPHPFTQNRLAKALETSSIPIEVIWFPTDNPGKTFEQLKAASFVIVTVWAATIKTLNRFLCQLNCHIVVYVEDLWDARMWHKCRFARSYLGTSLFHYEPEVRKTIQSIYPRIGNKSFQLLAHFGYSDIASIPFDEKRQKIIFPSRRFCAKTHSALRMDRYRKIVGSPKLKALVEFLDGSAKLEDRRFIEHLGKYMGVLVVVPGLQVWASFVVRKVFECASVGSLILMDFGKADTVAERGMKHLGFLPDTHYIDVTSGLEKISFGIENLETYKTIAQNGYRLVQENHLVNNRIAELQDYISKCLRD